MSSEKQTSETKNINTETLGNEESQSTETAGNTRDEDKSLSHNKCQATGSECKPRNSTAFLASTRVPFWKDRKVWLQIAIVGVQLYVFSLAILLGDLLLRVGVRRRASSVLHHALTS